MGTAPTPDAAAPIVTCSGYMFGGHQEQHLQDPVDNVMKWMTGYLVKPAITLHKSFSDLWRFQCEREVRCFGGGGGGGGSAGCVETGRVSVAWRMLPKPADLIDSTDERCAGLASTVTETQFYCSYGPAGDGRAATSLRWPGSRHLHAAWTTP